jgi:tetratricopeptide (TPR) repeat protein
LRIVPLVPAALLACLPLLGAGSLPWVQTTAHLLLALAVSATLWERARSIGRASPGVSPALLLLGIYGALSLAAAWRPVYPHSVDRGVLNDLAGLSFFFLAAESPSVRSSLRGGLAAGAAACVLAALPDAVLRVLGRGSAPAGTMVNANVLSAYLVLAGPTAALWWQERHRAGILFSIPAVFVLAATGSRAALAVVVLEALLLLPWDRVARALPSPWRRRETYAGVFFFSIVFAVRTALASLDADRLGWWRSAWRMGLSAPFGAGPGAFGEAYPRFRAVLLGQNTLFAHNFLLEAFAERGAAGTAVLIFFLIVLFRAASRRFHAGSPAFRAVFAGALSFAAHGFFHVGFSFPASAWSFWALAGFLWGESSPAVPAAAGSSSAPSMSRRWAAAGGTFLAAGAAVFSFRIFQGEEAVERAAAAFERGDVPAASRAVAGGLGWDPRSPELYSLRAAAETLSGNPSAAHEDALRAVALAPGSARFRAEAGESAARLGRPDEARAHFEEAVRLLPLNAGYRARLEELARGKD